MESVGEFVHVGFAGEVIRGSGEATIGALAQRGIGLVEFCNLIRDVVGALDGGASGIVIVELPTGDEAIFACAAADIDDTGRTEVGPVEFFFARPLELDGLASSFCKAGGFYGAFSGVLAAIAGAGGRDENADL